MRAVDTQDIGLREKTGDCDAAGAREAVTDSALEIGSHGVWCAIGRPEDDASTVQKAAAMATPPRRSGWAKVVTIRDIRSKKTALVAVSSGC